MIAQVIGQNQLSRSKRQSRHGKIAPRYEPPGNPMPREGTKFLEQFALASALHFNVPYPA
jgi:hypothetical protein